MVVLPVLAAPPFRTSCHFGTSTAPRFRFYRTFCPAAPAEDTGRSRNSRRTFVRPRHQLRFVPTGWDRSLLMCWSNRRKITASLVSPRSTSLACRTPQSTPIRSSPRKTLCCRPAETSRDIGSFGVFGSKSHSGRPACEWCRRMPVSQWLATARRQGYLFGWRS